MSDYSYTVEAGDGQGSQPGQPDAQVVGGGTADRGEVSVEGVDAALAALSAGGDGQATMAAFDIADSGLSGGDQDE